MGEYFKELPEFGMGLKIESESIPEGESLVSLVISVRECILNLDDDGIHAFEKKKTDPVITFKDTARLFRRKERLTNTKHLLQYLLLFLEDMPPPERVRQLPENPFIQFRDFVIAWISDLKEDDVVDAVLREYEELGIINSSNLWVFKGKIRLFHDNLKESLRHVKEPVPDSYKALFLVLKKISLFWFGIRREDLKRIRKSDLFIYKLARILINKIRASEESQPVKKPENNIT